MVTETKGGKEGDKGGGRGARWEGKKGGGGGHVVGGGGINVLVTVTSNMLSTLRGSTFTGFY